MPFQFVPALVAGFVATVVMTLLMKMARQTGMTQMPSFPLMTGSMLSGQRPTAQKWGVLIHYIVMGTVVFGLIYAALFSAFGTASWLAGLVIGVVHGVVVGGIAMPMMGAIHPRLEPVRVAGGETVREEGGEVHLVEPGFFGNNWGGMTPIGVVMGHAVYGLVLAIVYSLLV
jgi:uncharacterized membrane protein YagU involved in acid resistance